MLKKWWLLVVFLVGLLVSIYINFPLERFVESRLGDLGVRYESLEVNRFPIVLKLKEVNVEKLPVKIEELTVHPSVLSLISREKHFAVDAKLCSGVIQADVDYPLRSVKFSIEGLKVEDCKNSSILDISGYLSGRGDFQINPASLSVIAGSGEFGIRELRVGNLKFGVLSFPGIGLGDLNGSYKVERDNLISILAKSSGKDAQLMLSGTVELNLKNLSGSYVNLKVGIKFLSGRLKGKKFSFKLRGFAKNLSIR